MELSENADGQAKFRPARPEVSGAGYLYFLEALYSSAPTKDDTDNGLGLGQLSLAVGG